MKVIGKFGGFSLIETLIALIILYFALLALAGLMVTTTRNNSVGGHMTEAATLAQDKLEEFRATPFDNVLTGNDQKMGSHGIQYARNWNVVTNADGNLRTVTLNISWTDKYNHSIRSKCTIDQKVVKMALRCREDHDHTLKSSPLFLSPVTEGLRFHFHIHFHWH